MLPATLVGWQPHPGYIPPNCPYGLEYLLPLNYLFVQQTVELLEIITDCETENQYFIRNSYGQNVYYMMEDSDLCARDCFPRCRPFEMNVLAQNNAQVLRFKHPSSCWLNSIKVYDIDGNFIGRVNQDSRCCKTEFSVFDGMSHRVFYIKGPAMPTCCQGGDVDFKLLSLDMAQEVGRISKHWAGSSTEIHTDADVFGIFFPVDLEVRMKAVLLGASVLIDMIYYESSPHYCI